MEVSTSTKFLFWFKEIELFCVYLMSGQFFFKFHKVRMNFYSDLIFGQRILSWISGWMNLNFAGFASYCDNIVPKFNLLQLANVPKYFAIILRRKKKCSLYFVAKFGKTICESCQPQNFIFTISIWSYKNRKATLECVFVFKASDFFFQALM